MLMTIILVLVSAHLLYTIYTIAKKRQQVAAEELGDGPDLEAEDKAMEAIAALAEEIEKTSLVKSEYELKVDEAGEGSVGEKFNETPEAANVDVAKVLAQYEKNMQACQDHIKASIEARTLPGLEALEAEVRADLADLKKSNETP